MVNNFSWCGGLSNIFFNSVSGRIDTMHIPDSLIVFWVIVGASLHIDCHEMNVSQVIERKYRIIQFYIPTAEITDLC